MKHQSVLATAFALSLSAVHLQDAHAHTAIAGASATTTGSSGPCASLSSVTRSASTYETDTGASSAATARSETQYLSRIASRYDNLAGSRSNLKSLVWGLRTGSEVQLTGASGTKPVTFTPATAPMGYANITRALNLAGKQLAAAGIKNPTPQQLQAALNGGLVKTAHGSTTLQGVLKLRSEGMGWGQIARIVGVHSDRSKTADETNGTERSSTATKAAGANALNRAAGSGVATASANGRGNANGLGGKLK